MKPNKETRIDFIILLACVLAALGIIVYKVNDHLNFKDWETRVLISDRSLNITAIETIHEHQLQLLKTRAKELLSEQVDDLDAFKKRLVSVEGKGWELLPEPSDSTTKIGRINGHGSIAGLSEEVLREIRMAEKLNSFFATTNENLPNAPFIYYISESDFLNVVPRYLDDFAFFQKEYHDYGFYKLGMPKNNTQKERYWTEPYIDSGGNGLMVTTGMPLYHEGDFKGVICIDMLFNDIAKYLKNDRSYHKHVSLINTSGQVVSSTFKQMAYPDTIPTLAQLIDFEENDIGFFPLDRFTWYKNKRVLVSSIPNSQWYLLHFQTRTEFIKEAFNYGTTRFLALVFLLMVVYLLLNANRMRIENSIQKQKAEKANATKDKLFYIIAHDLRSPFHSLIGLSDILHHNFDGFSVTEQKEYFGHIRAVILKAHELLEDLLVWAQLQNEGIKYEPEVVSLHVEVEKTRERLLQVANDKSIRLVNEVNPDLSINADTNMLSTVLRNIVSNALKFTPKDGSVTISAVETNGFAQIAIADTGLGIAQNRIDKIFDLGEKTSTKGTEGESGTGLGLSVCKEFIELHGGNLSVESTLEMGSTFYFTIPLTTSAVEIQKDKKERQTSLRPSL